MKTDLATSIVAAIAGILIAYFVTNMFLGSPEDFTYKVVDTKVEASLVEPNPEIFNYKALDPTVEVYIKCEDYPDAIDCVETDQESQENQ